jgi:hypothetical protein
MRRQDVGIEIESSSKDLGQGRSQDDDFDFWIIGSLVNGLLQREKELGVECVDLAGYRSQISRPAARFDSQVVY